MSTYAFNPLYTATVEVTEQGEWLINETAQRTMKMRLPKHRVMASIFLDAFDDMIESATSAADLVLEAWDKVDEEKYPNVRPAIVVASAPSGVRVYVMLHDKPCPEIESMDGEDCDPMLLVEPPKPKYNPEEGEYFLTNSGHVGLVTESLIGSGFKARLPSGTYRYLLGGLYYGEEHKESFEYHVSQWLGTHPDKMCVNYQAPSPSGYVTEKVVCIEPDVVRALIHLSLMPGKASFSFTDDEV